MTADPGTALKVLAYVRHRPLCLSGGGGEWADQDHEICDCGLAPAVAALSALVDQPRAAPARVDDPPKGMIHGD
jgi:hypothetical protein